MRPAGAALAGWLLAALLLPAAGPAAASEWQRGDVEAARRYRTLERERAERYRAEVAEAERAREAEARREPSPSARRAVDPAAPGAPGARGGLLARVWADLEDATLRWGRHAAARLAAEFEPWVRDLARRLFASLRQAAGEAWCEGEDTRLGCGRA